MSAWIWKKEILININKQLIIVVTLMVQIWADGEQSWRNTFYCKHTHTHICTHLLIHVYICMWFLNHVNALLIKSKLKHYEKGNETDMGNSRVLPSSNMFCVRFTNFLKCFYKFGIFLISYKSEHYKYMN